MGKMIDQYDFSMQFYLFSIKFFPLNVVKVVIDRSTKNSFAILIFNEKLQEYFILAIFQKNI